jgi:hypothetical protein
LRQYDGFIASTIFPRICHCPTFLIFTIKKCSERTIRECHEVTAKATVALTEVSKSDFQKCFTIIGKHVSLSKGTTCVTIDKVTYFCVINQFSELFEATLLYTAITRQRFLLGHI